MHDPNLWVTVLSSSVVAAAVSLLANLWLDRSRVRENERVRLRAAFAEAFDTYSQYIEFGYAIRRRRPDKPEEERLRLSEELRRIQGRLSYYRAWTTFEDPASGIAYETLLRQAREVAGTAMKQAWRDPAVASDSEMVISRQVIDLGPLREHEECYLRAVQDRLEQLTPRHVLQRTFRRAAPGSTRTLPQEPARAEPSD